MSDDRSEDEELLLLRINALKSTSRSKLKSLSTVSEEITQDTQDEVKFERSSRGNGSVAAVEQDITTVPDLEKHSKQTQVTKSNTSQIEELKLREEALKTLLIKRMLSAEEKCNVIQNETVSSTTAAREQENEQDNISVRETSEDILKLSVAVKNDTSCPHEENEHVMKTFEDLKCQSASAKNIKTGVEFQTENVNNEKRVNPTGSRISLGDHTSEMPTNSVQDKDEGCDTIQSDVITSCSTSKHNTHPDDFSTFVKNTEVFDEKNDNQQALYLNTELTQSHVQIEPNENSVSPNLLIQQPDNAEEFILFLNKTDDDIDPEKRDSKGYDVGLDMQTMAKDVPETSIETTVVETIDNSTMDDSSTCSEKIEITGGLNREYLDCEPGPSGYQKNTSTTSEIYLDRFYESSSEESIQEVTPPRKNPPPLIEVSSGTEDETTHKKPKLKVGNTRKIRKSLIQYTASKKNDEDLGDCSICLGPFGNRSFLNECFHSFCYLCIIQWSELSKVCPLCKATFSSIIHSVTKDLDYQQQDVTSTTKYHFCDETTTSSQKHHRERFSRHVPEEERRLNFESNGSFVEDSQNRVYVSTIHRSSQRRFRYRSTMVDPDAYFARREESQAILQQNNQRKQQKRIDRRLKWSATKDRRKAVYSMKMAVQEVKQRGVPKFRNISPKFFEDNPALKHRLVPWLLRDLNVLLGNDDETIRFVMSMILRMISKIAMDSDEFVKQLEPFLFDEAKHFVDELMSFASSPYDMKGYDTNVVYTITKRNSQADRTVESQVLTMDQQNLRKHLFGDDVEVVNVDHAEDIDVDVTENPNVSQTAVEISDEDIEAAADGVDIVPHDQATKTTPHSLESDEDKQEDMLIPYIITPKKKPPCEDKKEEENNDDKSRESCSSEDNISYSPVENGKKERKRKRKRKHKHKKKRVKVERPYENESESEDETSDSNNKREHRRSKKKKEKERSKKKERQLKKKQKHKKRHKKRRKVSAKSSNNETSSESDNSETEDEESEVEMEISKRLNSLKKRYSQRQERELYLRQELARLKAKSEKSRELSKTIQEKIENREKRKHEQRIQKPTKPAKKAETLICQNISNSAEVEKKPDHVREKSTSSDENITEESYLKLLKPKYKKDLIKDGDKYKTREEVVYELLNIEKALYKRKEEKVKSKQDIIKHQEEAEKKRQKSEKSYQKLMIELQEIETKINSCRKFFGK